MPGKHSAFKLRSGNKPSPFEFFKGDISRARMYNPDYSKGQEDITEDSQSELEPTDYNQENMGMNTRPSRINNMSRARMFKKPDQMIDEQDLPQDYTNTPPMEQLKGTRGFRNAEAIAAMQDAESVTADINDPFGVKRKKSNPGYLGSNM